MASSGSSSLKVLLGLVFLLFGVTTIMYGSYTHSHGRDFAAIDSLQRRLHEREEQVMHLLAKAKEYGASKISGEANTALRGGLDVAEGKPDVNNLEDEKFRNDVFRYNTRYWLETKPVWPKEPIPPKDKFVTFSPWKGGFNNIRMSLEMAVAFAAATDRTLVMPPKYKMYLRGKSDLSSYFDYEDLRRGISVVTYDEFYDLVDFGKYQQEKFEEDRLHSSTERYYKGLKSMPGTYNTKDHWKDQMIGGQVVYCIPSCPNKEEAANERDPNKIQALKNEFKYFEQWARKLTRFDTNDPMIANAKVVHFPENLLGHFYTMVYHRDVEKHRHILRVVRDHVHFREDIIERAERIIARMGDFKFSCLHVRRNEFQFKDAWTSAEQIVENTKKLIKPGEVVYISTDELSDEKERKKSWHDPSATVRVAKHTWFEPMKKEWGIDNVFFLSDFFNELLEEDTEIIHLGCIESVVCSRARAFVGTRKSTFSGYINRMRGYMHDVGQKVILETQEHYPSGYYNFFQPQWVSLNHHYGASHPYWGLEYKTAWEGVYPSVLP